jgi:hypothetical protein
VVLPKGINRLATRGPVFQRHFIEPIKQRQNVIGLDPGLAEFMGHVILLVKGINQPIGQRAPPLGPGRQWKVYGNGLLPVLGCPLQQVARQREQQGRFARPRGAYNQQCSIEAIEGVNETGRWGLHLVGKLWALNIEVQGAGDHGGTFDQT